MTGIHTWTWREIKPMLVNSPDEIELFEPGYYKINPDTVVITTSNSQEIEQWKIVDKGLIAVLKPRGWQQFKIEEIK